MKKYVLKFVIFYSVPILFLCNNSFAQNLSLDEVIKLRTKVLGDVEEFMIAKNWIIDEAEAPSSDQMGKLLFAYKKTDKKYSTSEIILNKNPTIALAFLTYYYDDDANYNRVHIQTISKDIYLEYLNRIKFYKCEMIKSEVIEGNIVKIYKGNTITFKITVYNTDVPAYTFLLTNNNDSYNNN